MKRTDIQVLRGIAVCLVIFDHVRLGPSAGYLGVDIFFVISGYLIAQMVFTDLQSGSFSLTDFYLRRARRIVPPAYVTLFLVVALAPLFQVASQIADLWPQLLGSLTYTVNYILMEDTDYFAAAAETKPLLHMWSLAIEAQFYLLFPLVLMLLPSHRRRAGILSLTVASGAACLVVVASNEVYAFYLLPTRAWELLLGASIAVFSAELARLRTYWLAAFWPAFVGLLAVPFIKIDTPHPGLQAIVVCLCTAVILLARHPALDRTDPAKATARIGDISYSLYLVHWPIIVFVSSAHVGPISLPVKLLMLAASFAAAWLMYSFVEKPGRSLFRKVSWRPLLAASLAAFVISGAYRTAVALDDSRTFAENRVGNHGLGKRCNFSLGQFSERPECAVGKPDTLVWGDSFAMHLVDGLIGAGVGLRQATSSACAPILGMAPDRAYRGTSRTWSERCITFNDAVLQYAEQSAETRTVIIASHWATVDGVKVYQRSPDGEIRSAVSSADRSFAAIQQLVQRLRNTGKRVIFVEPPPNGGGSLNVGACAERMLAGRMTFDAPPGCEFSRTEYERREAKKMAFIGRVRRELDLPVLRLADGLCEAGSCKAIAGDEPIFRDRSHLSKAGSRYVLHRVPVHQIIAATD